jgi:tRNA pseudouridine38-40 synthase
MISYDGTEFQGWQKQPGLATVQATTEAVLSQFYNEPIRVVASGRTDAGTHAVGQVIHFEAPKIHASEHKLVRALNSLLPDGVVVKGAWEAPPEFHSRKSAVRKTYIYRIWNHPIRSALWRQRAMWVPHSLDLKFLNQLARATQGRKDFKSFQTTGTDVKTTIRRIDGCDWRLRAPGLVEFRITGSGFLKQMVRNLVGTQLHLERNKMELTDYLNIFEARDRQAAKTTAPAHGLYLYRVEYPADLDNKCRKL